MQITIKCGVCDGKFGVGDLHIRYGAARCPYCAAPNVLDQRGPSIHCKIIGCCLPNPVKGTFVYCAKCMEVFVMPNFCPRCPSCDSLNVYGVVANFTVPSRLLVRIVEDNDLVQVAYIDGQFRGGRYAVYISKTNMKALDEDPDTRVKRIDV